MGRQLRRVALDFEWPLNKVWKGFINPIQGPCPEDQKTCFRGQTAAGLWLDTITRFLVIVADDALDAGKRKERGGSWPHPYLVDMPTAPTYEIPRDTPREMLGPILAERHRNRDKYVIPPSKDLAELLSALMAKGGNPKGSFGFMGTGAAWDIQRAIFAAAGIDPKGWGQCPVCKGEGMDPAIMEAHNAWEEYEPPEGPGYQLWETVSEGSPISPVFPTRETFIEYLTSKGSTRSAAECFTESGWTPSAVVVPGKGFVSGIEVAEAMRAK
jgi:hypothetical protein